MRLLPFRESSHRTTLCTTLRTTFLLLAAAAAGMGALLALFPAAGHDQLWFLVMGRRWLAGAVLYGPEAFDSNPPGIVWASAVPVMLGRFLHVAATLPAKVLVLLVEGICAWLAYSFLRRSRRAAAEYEAAGLAFLFLLLAVVLPARDFGQRDQLLSVMILPYVLAAAVETGTFKALRVAAGVLAAVGICLKPQYALIPLAVEAVLLLRPAAGLAGDARHQPVHKPPRIKTLLRPEPVLIVVIGAAYLVAIAHWTPLYFSLALPLLRQTYWAVGHLSPWRLAWEAVELCVLELAAVTLFLRSRQRSETVRLLLVAGGAASLAYFLQGTGWYYQQIPGLVLSGAALGLQLLDLLAVRKRTVPRWVAPAAGSLGMLALALTTHFMGYPFTRDRAFAIESPDPAFFAGLTPGTPIAMLTTSVDETMMPVERYGLTWGQRTNNLWLLPATLRSESPQAGSAPRHILSPVRIAALDSLQKRWMVEDLTHWKPQVVLVERCQVVRCQLLEDRADNLLAWFLNDPAFAGLWQHYRFLRTSGRFDEYVLVR